MKNYIKKFLLGFSSAISCLTSKKALKLIYYHDVVESKNGFSYMKIDIDKFKEQMEFLKINNYKTITFDELHDLNTSEYKNKTILITFDDGWLSNYTRVFSIMKELNLKFNIFLEVGAIGNKKNYLTWDFINEMVESGLVGLGAHTFSHKDARLIDNTNVNEEILKANELIEEYTGKKVNDFCFPYGYYDTKIISYLSKLECYKRLYTSDGIPAKKKGSVIVIGRIGISNDDTMNVFINKVKGKYNGYYIFTTKVRKLIHALHRNGDRQIK